MLQVQVSTGGYGCSGGTATADTFQPGSTTLTLGGITIRVEDTGDSARSTWVESDPRYADLDVTCDAPFRYREAVSYWMGWLTNRSAPEAIAA